MYDPEKVEESEENEEREREEVARQPLRLRDVLTWDQVEEILEEHDETIRVGGAARVSFDFFGKWEVRDCRTNTYTKFPTLAEAMREALRLSQTERSENE